MAGFFSSDALKALKLKLSTKRSGKENKPVNTEEEEAGFRRPVLKNNVSLMTKTKTNHEPSFADTNSICSNRPTLREVDDEMSSSVEVRASVHREMGEERVERAEPTPVAERPAQPPSVQEFAFAVPQARAPKPARPSASEHFSHFRQTAQQFYYNDCMTDFEKDYHLLKLICYAEKILDLNSLQDDGFSHTRANLMDCYQRTGIGVAGAEGSVVGSCYSYAGRNSISRFPLANGFQNSTFQPIEQPHGDRDTESDRQSVLSGLPQQMRRPLMPQMPRYRRSSFFGNDGDSLYSFCRSNISNARARTFNHGFDQGPVLPFEPLGAGNYDRRNDYEDQRYQSRGSNAQNYTRDYNVQSTSNYTRGYNVPSTSNNTRGYNVPSTSNNNRDYDVPSTSNNNRDYNVPSTSNNYSSQRYPPQANQSEQYQRGPRPSRNEESNFIQRESNVTMQRNNISTLQERAGNQREQDRHFTAPIKSAEEVSRLEMQPRNRSNHVPGTPMTSRYGRVIKTPNLYKPNPFFSSRNKADRTRNETPTLLTERNVEEMSMRHRLEALTERHATLQARHQDRREQLGARDQSLSHASPRDTSLRTRSGRTVREPVKFWSQDSSVAGIAQERPNLKRKRSPVVHLGKTVKITC